MSTPMVTKPMAVPIVQLIALALAKTIAVMNASPTAVPMRWAVWRTAPELPA